MEACILHFDVTGSLLSIAELTEAAFVSERRLRSAFTANYGVSPSRYLRQRALDRAREQLIDPANGSKISDLASDAGFTNFGRFARYYRTAFGELPSETLAST